MLRPIRFFFPAGLLFPLLLNAQNPPEITAILERLDRLERQNQQLIEEVRSLRAQLQTSGAGSQPAAQALVPASPEQTAPLDQRADVLDHRVDEQAQSKVEASQKFPIRLTGMALFNAFSDSRQSGGTDYPTFAALTGAAHSGATVRQTILGLEYRGPEAIAGGRVSGSVYMDFASGTPPLSQTMRLRTASIQIDWNTRSIMAGLEKPIFNPREPSSLAQVAASPLAGAGNLWLWIPQVRLGQDFSFGSRDGLKALVGVVQTREAGPYPGSPATGTLEATRPGLEGRFNFFHKMDDERRFEIAPGFHVSTTHAGGFSIPSSVFSLDWFWNPVRAVEFTGAYYRGQNVALLGTGGIRQGFALYPDHAEAVESQGGWGQLTLHVLRRLDFHFFSGQQDDRNADLVNGNIGKNVVFGGNVYFRIAPNVLLGWETTQTRTVYVQQPIRINNHYDLALGYLF